MSCRDRVERFLDRLNYYSEVIWDERFDTTNKVILFIMVMIIILYLCHFVFIPFIMRFL